MSCKGWYSVGPKWWAPWLTLGNWNTVNNSAYIDTLCFVEKKIIYKGQLSYVVQRLFSYIQTVYSVTVKQVDIVEAAAFVHVLEL